MGVSADLDMMRRYGEMIKAIPTDQTGLKTRPQQAPLLAEVSAPTEGGPALSTGLAAAQNKAAFGNAAFDRSKDQGMVVAGDGLIHIAANLGEIDRQHAEGIRKLFPDPPAVQDGDR